jgi:hypothetical protein
MKLPKSWDEITLKQFAMLQEIQNDELIDDTEKSIETIRYLAGLTYPQALELPLKEKAAALKTLSFLNTLDKISPKAKKHIWIKGKRHKITLDVSELTQGQYIDIKTFLKEPDKSFENLHNVFAVICQPLKYGFKPTKYDGIEHKDRALLFYETLTISQVYPVLVFFCTLSDNLTINILASLKKQTQKMKTNLMENTTVSK